MYASKRRQRNFKRVRDPPKTLATTNPSKRHRERLNGELETVAMLLPYDNSTISRLDKLSVLRLAVSFLQCKAHFQACIHNSSYLNYSLSTHIYSYQPHISTPFSNKVPTIFDPRIGTPMLDHEESNFEEISLKALGGFILVLNDNGEIYYASENVENFLGFHQSDVLHQPIYDLIHSEDRDDIRQQFDTNYSIPPTSGAAHVDIFAAQNFKYLDRNVNARFRCLLDNTCGFLRIDMRGKLFSIHGLPSSYVMGRTNSGPVLGMICICTPFVPPSTSELASEDMILKTKHQLDSSLVSMDQRVYDILEVNDCDLPISFYELVHVEDAICMAEAHKEAIKNGSSGLLVYRLVSKKSRRIYFVQSSCRLFYKNGKPESIGLTHRLLNEVEGNMLLEKRSSLKAKLLSFDDSFLQSPRNLQSTAALPLISSVKDDDECFDSQQASSSSSSSSSNFQSSQLPIVKSKKRKEELKTSLNTILPSRIIVPQPSVVPIPIIPASTSQHLTPNQFDFPLFDHSYQNQSIHWQNQHHYHNYHHHHLHPLPPPPPPPQPFPIVNYSHQPCQNYLNEAPMVADFSWNEAVDSSKMFCHPNSIPNQFADYSMISSEVPKPSHDGFDLISEVSNLLGS